MRPSAAIGIDSSSAQPGQHREAAAVQVDQHAVAFGSEMPLFGV